MQTKNTEVWTHQERATEQRSHEPLQTLLRLNGWIGDNGVLVLEEAITHCSSTIYVLTVFISPFWWSLPKISPKISPNCQRNFPKIPQNGGDGEVWGNAWVGAEKFWGSALWGRGSAFMGRGRLGKLPQWGWWSLGKCPGRTVYYEQVRYTFWGSWGSLSEVGSAKVIYHICFWQILSEVQFCFCGILGKLSWIFMFSVRFCIEYLGGEIDI